MHNFKHARLDMQTKICFFSMTKNKRLNSGKKNARVTMSQNKHIRKCSFSFYIENKFYFPITRIANIF